MLLGLLEAIEFATIKHHGQVRKITGEPYICHTIRVAAIADYFLDSGDKFTYPSYAIIAILHDTIEDTDTTYEELKNKFGYFVAGVVQELTNPEKLDGEKRAAYKVRINQRLTESSRLAQKLKLCDRLDNIRSRGPIKPENAKWLAKYAKETEDLIAAIGDCHINLSNVVLSEVKSVLQRLPKGYV